MVGFTQDEQHDEQHQQQHQRHRQARAAQAGADQDHHSRERSLVQRGDLQRRHDCRSGLKNCTKVLTPAQNSDTLLLVMNNTMTTYNTIELNVDETIVLVTYAIRWNGRVRVIDVQGVGTTPKDDVDWVKGQIGNVARMIERRLEQEQLEPNFDEI